MKTDISISFRRILVTVATNFLHRYLDHFTSSAYGSMTTVSGVAWDFRNGVAIRMNRRIGGDMAKTLSRTCRRLPHSGRSVYQFFVGCLWVHDHRLVRRVGFPERCGDPDESTYRWRYGENTFSSSSGAYGSMTVGYSVNFRWIRLPTQTPSQSTQTHASVRAKDGVRRKLHNSFMCSTGPSTTYATIKLLLVGVHFFFLELFLFGRSVMSLLQISMGREATIA